MAENKNIAEMADRLSSEIFKNFGWDIVGTTNKDWDCVNRRVHNKKTHPSDVVFSYDSPYRNEKIYLNTDLKSFGAGTINATNLHAALQSLSFGLECAKISPQFSKLYLDGYTNKTIHGMLFIYNHDNSYTGDFDRALKKACNDLKLQTNNKIYIVGPEDVLYLNTISLDMNLLKYQKEIPEDSKFSFFYPDRVRIRTRKLDYCPATIETLLSPYQTVAYTSESNGERGILLYYKEKGYREEEFLYLLDYLAHYQLLKDFDSILIRSYKPDSYAPTFFEKAQRRYTDYFNQSVDYLKKVKMKEIRSLVPKFSEIEIGMDCR